MAVLSAINNDYVLMTALQAIDTVCMCKEFREMEEGTCHCQLYVKTKD